MRAVRFRLALLGILALACLAASVGAQPVGSEFQVNTYTTKHQRPQAGHAIAADAGGNFVVVWSSRGQDGSGYGVFGQRFDAAGEPLGAEFRVNSHTPENQNLPAVAAAAGGDFVVVWSGDQRDGSYDGIFGQRYDSAGAPVGDQFRVNSYTTSRQTLPAVSSDPAGNFVVVWSSDGQDDGYFYGIFGQRYDSGGARLGSEFRINSYTPSTQWFPSVASDASGNFVVVWESYNQLGLGFYADIFGQRYDSAGRRLGAEFRVNTTTSDNQRLPAVASDPVGNFVVVWSHTVQYVGTYGIRGQRYDSAGVPLGGEFRVHSADRPELGQNSAVAYDASGNFLVAWAGRGDGSQVEVFGRRYDSGGVPRGGQFQINAYTTDSQSTASVAATGPGQFVAAWQSDGQDGSGYGVFGRRLEFAGHSLAVGSPPHHLQDPARRRVEGHRSRNHSSASAANR